MHGGLFAGTSASGYLPGKALPTRQGPRQIGGARHRSCLGHYTRRMGPEADAPWADARGLAEQLRKQFRCRLAPTIGHQRRDGLCCGKSATASGGPRSLPASGAGGPRFKSGRPD